MAAMPQDARQIVCKASGCQQIIARVHGQTIRPIGDVSIRDGRIAIICPACGHRSYLTRADTHRAA